MSNKPKIAAVIAQFRARLSQAGVDHALRDARLIVGDVCGLKPLDIITGPDRSISLEDLARAEEMLARRMRGESIHRIIGHREFYSLDLEISAETLEPRPDTEVLVDALLPHLKVAEIRAAPRVLDLGTGTGAICLSLLAGSISATGIGVDISEDALATSLRNATKNNLDARYRAVKSNWFEAVEGCFDIIVSNPPYIRSNVIPTLDVIVRGFDPIAALDGGPDGLEPYRVIARQAPRYLNVDGVVGVEIGYDQRLDVCAIFEDAEFSLIESVQDYGGNDRAVLFKLADKNALSGCFGA